FLILAGVFQRGWGWAVAGAVAIVLAAMYVLRVVSAVLHREVGPAVSDSALDLRPAELGVTVPMIACLLALSIWPAAITQPSFRGDHGAADVAGQFKCFRSPTSTGPRSRRSPRRPLQPAAPC